MQKSAAKRHKQKPLKVAKRAVATKKVVKKAPKQQQSSPVITQQQQRSLTTTTSTLVPKSIQLQPFQQKMPIAMKQQQQPSFVKQLPQLFSVAKRFGGGWGYTHYTPKEEVEQRIMDILKELPAIDPVKLNNKAHFQTDLGLDSLQQVELIMMLEQSFHVEINDDDAVKITSVPEAVHYFSHTPYTV